MNWYDFVDGLINDLDNYEVRKDFFRFCKSALREVYYKFFADKVIENPVNTFVKEINAARDSETGEFKPDSKFYDFTPEQFTELKDNVFLLSKLWRGNARISFADLLVRIRFDEEMRDIYEKFKASVAKAKANIVANVEEVQESKSESKLDRFLEKHYAHGLLSVTDLISCDEDGRACKIYHDFDDMFVSIFLHFMEAFEKDAEHFIVVDGCLKDANGAMCYIKFDKDTPLLGTVTDAFYVYLTHFDSWKDLACGVLEDEVYRLLSLDIGTYVDEVANPIAEHILKCMVDED